MTSSYTFCAFMLGVLPLLRFVFSWMVVAKIIFSVTSFLACFSWVCFLFRSDVFVPPCVTFKVCVILPTLFWGTQWYVFRPSRVHRQPLVLTMCVDMLRFVTERLSRSIETRTHDILQRSRFSTRGRDSGHVLYIFGYVYIFALSAFQLEDLSFTKQKCINNRPTCCHLYRSTYERLLRLLHRSLPLTSTIYVLLLVISRV